MLHAWKHRPPSHRQRRDMVLLAHIRNQHRLNLGSYGRSRMSEELNELGIRFGQPLHYAVCAQTARGAEWAV